MEKQGIVSYWIGNGDTQQNLNRLTEYSISNGGHGDFVPAPFCRALGIDRYEPDYLGGKRFLKQLTNLRLMFHGDPIPQELLDAWPRFHRPIARSLFSITPMTAHSRTLRLTVFLLSFSGPTRIRSAAGGQKNSIPASFGGRS